MISISAWLDEVEYKETNIVGLVDGSLYCLQVKIVRTVECVCPMVYRKNIIILIIIIYFVLYFISAWHVITIW